MSVTLAMPCGPSNISSGMPWSPQSRWRPQNKSRKTRAWYNTRRASCIISLRPGAARWPACRRDAPPSSPACTGGPLAVDVAVPVFRRVAGVVLEGQPLHGGAPLPVVPDHPDAAEGDHAAEIGGVLLRHHAILVDDAEGGLVAPGRRRRACGPPWRSGRAASRPHTDSSGAPRRDSRRRRPGPARRRCPGLSTASQSARDRACLFLLSSRNISAPPPVSEWPG